METLNITATANRNTGIANRNAGIAQSGTFTQKISAHVNAFEEQRLGWMAIMILVQTCLGSLACMHILMNGAHDLQFIACAVITMACNAILIAQGPAKWCLGSFYLSIVLNTTLMLINL